MVFCEMRLLETEADPKLQRNLTGVITSAKEVIFLVVLVCLLVCLSVRNFMEKLMDGLIG